MHARELWRTTRQLQVTLLIVGVFIAGFMLGNRSGVSMAQSNLTPPPEAEESFQAFWQTFNLIQSDYLEDVDVNVLVDGAISGMVNALGDQYSGYMDPQTFPLMESDLSGELEGIGAVVRTIEETGEIEVVNVINGSPAEEAGVRPGDIFVEVDGVNVLGMTQLELVTLVRGPAGTEVNITFRRGDEQVNYTIKRERISIPNIASRVIEVEGVRVGYIKLEQFTENARAEIDTALASFGTIDVILLDLRGNPGGLLSSAIDVASAFLPDGVVLYEDFGNGVERTFEATGSYTDAETPFIVLVDERSASASELVSGAWQDRGRAVIIGEVTLGKGTVQTWQPLVNGGGVRLTIARWLTPNRYWIHEQGITPDIIVEWNPETYADLGTENDPQLNAALEHALTLVPAQ